MRKRKPRSDKGRVRVPVGRRSIRIVEAKRDSIDVDKLVTALLMLAEDQVADRSYSTGSTTDEAASE